MKKLGNIFKKSLMYLLLTVVFVTAVGAVYYFCLNTKSAKAYLEQRHLNVPYKETETGQLKLDIYMPKRKLFTKTPVLVYFHGGSWKSGSKNLKKRPRAFQYFLRSRLCSCKCGLSIDKRSKQVSRSCG